MLGPESFKNCVLCPRNCGVNRTEKVGFCGIGAEIKVASAFAHFGEEPVLTGIYGSGTIFFSGCNLGCVFCQNYEISHLCEGENVTVEELAEIMLYLQANGCHNINLVTPTHQIPLIVQALDAAKRRGLSVPVVYNCGGYEKVETLRELEGIIDIYMPDIKTFNRAFADKYLNAPDYPEIVKEAVREMFRQTGNLQVDKNGLAKKGVLIRHLIMPGYVEDSIAILNWIRQTLGRNAFVNIMDQYFPAYKASQFPEIARRITEEEYLTVYRHAKRLGLRLAVE
ncbi:radical SAM protein [Desulfurobacterium sp.]